MPTFVTHAISGLAVSSLIPPKSYSGRTALLCAVCALAPDLDAVTFKMGIPYGHWLGHRGFTHSLPFAALIASFALFTVRRVEPSGSRRMLLWGALFVSAASHGVLDALTNGGLGVAFFSPFDATRYFFPWNPIEVSPITVKRFFSSRGSTVLLSEFFWVVLPSVLAAAGLRWWRKSKVRTMKGT